MKTTRRGLFAWLGALTGAAAVSRVVPAEAEARPVFKHVATNPDWQGEYCAQLGGQWAGESEAMRAGRLLAEQHACDIEAGRKLRTPEDVLEMMRRDAYPRRSGRTTRALLDAVDIAKTGKNVLFAVAHSQFCDEAMRLLVKHAAPNLSFVRGNGRGYCINVLPAGVIDIVAAHRVTDDVLRGRRPPVVIRDHLCYEMGV